MTDKPKKTQTAIDDNAAGGRKCGIVMPISGGSECAEEHWNDVRTILFDAVEKADFEPLLVSDANDVGIIQRRIVQNLYSNPIVVCDVSTKNPNVMFELGLRLAFDKATIIVKDDKTAYSFDTAPIEHLEYPRDLRFGKIVEFKAKLAEKVRATFNESGSNRDYSTFLKHFGSFSVAKVETRNVSEFEYFKNQFEILRQAIYEQQVRFETMIHAARPSPFHFKGMRHPELVDDNEYKMIEDFVNSGPYTPRIGGPSEDEVKKFTNMFMHRHVIVGTSESNRKRIEDMVREALVKRSALTR